MPSKNDICLIYRNHLEALERDRKGFFDLWQALELIAMEARPDGTYNRDREACGQLAREALERHRKN